MNQTQNYQLNQWEASDRVQRTDFNADNAKIDAAIKAEADARAAGDAALQTAVAQKADTSALNTLTQTVNGKANTSALNSLSQTVSGLASSKADASALTAETARIDGELQRLEGARRTDLLQVYSWPVGTKQLNLDLTPFDLSKYVTLELRLSRITLSTQETLSLFLNNKKNCYNDEKNPTGALSTIGTLYSAGSGTEYTISGRLTIHLDGYGLAGEYFTLYSSNYSSSYVTEFRPNTWGVHPHHIPPSSLNSINIFDNSSSSSNATSVTGGTLYLMGHRF